MSEIRMVRQIVLKNPRELIPYENNARINDHVVPALVAAIKRFGFNQPVVIDHSNVLVCGHTRIKAALELRMREVPCVYVEGLTQEEIDAYRLADNKIAEQALWDYDKLKVELDKIGDDIKMSVFGFEDDIDTGNNGSGNIEPVKVNMDSYSVVVKCENENEAQELFDRLSSEGYKCSLSTL